MKIKTKKIKALRKEKLWSQEELSVASGLGIRTIQRAESSGSASMETVKALSAAFQLQREAIDFASFGFMIGLAAIFAVLFSTLTVKVNSDEISWYFGFGFLKKTVAVQDIVKAESVRNRLWYGFGIRSLGNGWLYNVSGLDAVELFLPENKRVRVGTDEPERLMAAINEAVSD